MITVSVMKELKEVYLKDVFLANKDILVKDLLYPGLIARVTSLKRKTTFCTKMNYTWTKELCSRLWEGFTPLLKRDTLLTYLKGIKFDWY